ncbi:MAG: N-sulfoglucosamine sulfohydrolase, partial [Limisphaerales bacterium]
MKTKCRILPLVMSLLTSLIAAQLHANPPNILLLVAEDLSPRIGSYGDAVAHTPNLDKLASQSTRYTQAFTTAGVCSPSRAALITGQHQISFAAQHMRSSTGPLGEYYAQPAPQVRAFPEILRQHGYYTFTDNKLDYQFSGVRAGSGPFTIWNQDGAKDTEWRNRAPGQPFFGLINFMETHESGVMRQSGKAHSETHLATQKWRAPITKRIKHRTPTDEVMVPPYMPDNEKTRADIARHYDNIRIMDERVGKILAALAADGLDKSTIVVWTTDHGDGLPRSKRELFDTGIHVPLLVKDPHQVRTRPIDDRLVSFVDLAPTILNWAGIPAFGYHHGQPLTNDVQRDYVFASRDRIDEIEDRQRAVRDARYKFIKSWHPNVPGGHQLAYRDNIDMVRAWRKEFQDGTLTPIQARWFQPVGRARLFDLEEDPFELHNLANDPAHRAILARLESALGTFLARVGDTSVIPEKELVKHLRLDGEIPITPAPVYEQVASQTTISSPIQASIGYRFVGESNWRLYTAALDLQGRGIEAKSVRYGWKESPTVRFQKNI